MKNIMFRISILGIPTEMNLSFFLLVAIMYFTGNGFLALYSALFSVLHELVHGIVARRLGYTPDTISTCLFGGIISLKEGYVLPYDELIIYLAGPLFNLAMAMLSYWILMFFPFLWLEKVLFANLILALFNLMPLYPLDGGKVINLYLSHFFGHGKSYTISNFFSTLFSIFLFFLGLYLVQYNVMNIFVSALAVNLFIIGRADSRFSFNRLMGVYRDLEKENKTWY